MYETYHGNIKNLKTGDALKTILKDKISNMYTILFKNLHFFRVRKVSKRNFEKVYYLNFLMMHQF